MKTTAKLFGLLLLAFLFTHCKGDIKRSMLPTATGLPYEVMVVMKPNAYQGPAGRALFNILNADVPGLPQSEPLMKISSVAPSNFEGFLKYIRNVIIVDISPQYTLTKFIMDKDEWADQQVILYIQSPSETALEHFLQQPENGEKIINFFYNSEINRTAKFYQKNFNKEAAKTIADLFGASICIPDFITVSKIGKEFFWITDNTASPMNIVVYAIPYTNKDAFTLESLVHVRDSVMKANIPGGPEGSYMTTARMAPTHRVLTLNGKYCVELRGLWEMHNDMMGGPFVSLTRLDEANNRVITVEAFVYAPSKEKRNLLKRAEAALYTLKLPGETQLPEVVVGIEPEQEKQ